MEGEREREKEKEREREREKEKKEKKKTVRNDAFHSRSPSMIAACNRSRIRKVIPLIEIIVGQRGGMGVYKQVRGKQKGTGFFHTIFGYVWDSNGVEISSICFRQFWFIFLLSKIVFTKG
jgi:hypothetical protein